MLKNLLMMKLVILKSCCQEAVHNILLKSLHSNHLRHILVRRKHTLGWTVSQRRNVNMSCVPKHAQIACNNLSLRGIMLRKLSTFCGERDRYGGIHIDLEKELAEDCDNADFERLLKDSVKAWLAEGSSSVWIKVPIARSRLIAVAARQGFQFHHAEYHHAMLCRWLDEASHNNLPRFATHQVGVAGCVVRKDLQQVLVVKDKHRKSSFWKFPGGLANLGEDFGDTARREIFEETGVESEFGGILALRQQHNQPGAFGRSDIYVICHMSPVTFDINPCSHEIEACEWVDLYDLERNATNSAVTLRVAHLIRLGLENGFGTVEIQASEFKSIYKGIKYKLFSRHLDAEDMSTYIHSVSNYHD